MVFYRHNLGWIFGKRFLMLTHVGRRSGRHYRTVLEVVGQLGTGPGREVVVVSGLGRSSDWYRNVRAAPAVEIAIGRRRFRPHARVLDPAQAAAVLARYERHNWLVAPLVRRVLSWLAGWRYDGTAQARARLVRELPLVAFRPADAPITSDQAAGVGDAHHA